MPEFLKQEVFLGLRFIDIVMIAGGLILVTSIFNQIMAKFRDDSIKKHQTSLRCPQCNWVGMASKHTMRCPKCGNKNLTAGRSPR